jgi:hypothetical protein
LLQYHGLNEEGTKDELVLKLDKIKEQSKTDDEDTDDETGEEDEGNESETENIEIQILKNLFKTNLMGDKLAIKEEEKVQYIIS